jgi:hypothetical protein
MKELRELSCSDCRKSVLVSESWTFKTCPQCHDRYAKSATSRNKVRNLKRKIKEAIEDVDLTQHPSLQNIEVFKTQVCYRFLGKIPLQNVLEKYLSAIEMIRRRQSDVTSRNETKRRLQETRENKRIFIDAYPCHNEECVRIRRLCVNKGKSPDDSFVIDSHLVKCDSCAKWRIYDRDNFEETDTSDAFADEKYVPTGALDPWSKGTLEDSQEDKVKKLGYDYKHSSNPSENILGIEGTKEYERADSVFADKVQERDPKLDATKQESEQTRQKLKEDYEKQERKRQGYYSTQEEIDEKYGKETEDQPDTSNDNETEGSESNGN